MKGRSAGRVLKLDCEPFVSFSWFLLCCLTSIQFWAYSIVFVDELISSFESSAYFTVCFFFNRFFTGLSIVCLNICQILFCVSDISICLAFFLLVLVHELALIFLFIGLS